MFLCTLQTSEELMKLPFKNRTVAGKELAKSLRKYKDRDDIIVLALPRGGVPVALEVAKYLNADLDLMLVRKLGAPGYKELAMGAIATGGIKVMNNDVVRSLYITPEAIEAIETEERKELERRETAYRGKRPLPDLQNQCVIVVDDGLATGATMHAAIGAIRLQSPARIVVAVPIAPQDTIQALNPKVDEMVCLEEPYPFSSIGQWYIDFSQVSDEEVRSILRQVWK